MTIHNFFRKLMGKIKSVTCILSLLLPLQVCCQKHTFGNAEWITVSYKEDTIQRPCPVFRKLFDATDKKIQSATLYITALGLYEAQLNGQRVGTDYFAPGLTTYDRWLPYRRYDVTNKVKSHNELQVMVGEGWYRGAFRSTNGEPRRNLYGREAGLLVCLEIHFQDGTVWQIASDSSWLCAESNIRYSELYDGEWQDTRMISSDWQPVKELGKQYTANIELIPADYEPVRKQERFHPSKLFTTPAGEQVIDFGQNMAGWVQLHVKGHMGDTIRLYHAEVLDQQGNFYTGNLREAKATDTYILNGEKQVLEPHFTYHGFRYVKLEGLKANRNNIKAIALYSDLKKTGTFSCSNPMLNRLQQNIEWSLNSNFFEIPTDCPQRSERLGWTGDAQVFAATASFLRDTRRFYAKWLRDLAMSQGRNGAVPAYVPLMARDIDLTRGAAGWGDAATILPWTLYEVYNDTAILRHQYASMKAWVDYIAGQSPDGLWKAGGYGDWYAQGPATSLPLIDQAFFVHSAAIVEKTAGVLQQPADQAKYRELADRARQLFYETYRDSLHTQTACILALQFKLLPDSLRAKTAARLVQLIHDNNNHLATGFLGTPFLLSVLSDYGYTGLAYQLLLQRDCPSWLYPITKGATTIWEKWDGIRPDGSFNVSSYNHYAYGAVGRWLYEHVAGIRPLEPGYRKILICPEPGGGLTWSKASYTNDYGKIVSEWKIRKDKLLLRVQIPPGTTATIKVPGKGNVEKGPGRYRFEGRLNETL